MTDTFLYQSVLQKLAQLSPNNLAQLDAFLSVLLGHNTSIKTEKIETSNDKSAIDWLEQLAQMGSFKSIEDPIEWQRNIRQDRELPYRYCSN
jgi:hypothetical protein